VDRRIAELLVLVCLPALLTANEPHWSFVAPARHEPPAFADAPARSWLRTPVDAFVLKRLRDKGLAPAADADRATLIRRLSFDLIGLPPTPAEIAAFVGDPRDDAYERLVERLLASPHYGERWAQHWLDVVRFAESDGFEYDRLRPGIWRYRDYVIRSFNEDKPYGRFLAEQLAGDELEPGKQALQIAAGFQRLGPVRRNAGNQEVAFSRNEVLTEMTDAVGMVVLGLTVGCARCHDHKSDDFSQTDYYRLQAFMAATHEHSIALADSKTHAEWKARYDKVSAELKELKEQLAVANAEERERLQNVIRKVEDTLPAPLPSIATVRDVAAERSAIHVLRRGLPERKGKRVEPGFPSALAATPHPQP
jgi:tellurite resistance protein